VRLEIASPLDFHTSRKYGCVKIDVQKEFYVDTVSILDTLMSVYVFEGG